MAHGLIAMLTAQLHDVAIDVVHLGGTALEHVLAHAGIVVLEVDKALHDGVDLLLAADAQVDAGELAHVKALAHELLAHVAHVRVGTDGAHLDLEHGAERVAHRVQHDLGHRHAHDVGTPLGAELGGREVGEELLAGRGALVVVLADVHVLLAERAHEVNFAGAGQHGSDDGGAAKEALRREVLEELLVVAHAVHGREADLVILEQRFAALEKAVELHLLDEDHPAVGVARVLLGVVDVDGLEVAVLVVARHVDAALLANLLDVGLPGVDEVDLLARVLLEVDAVAQAHGPRADDRILHARPFPLAVAQSYRFGETWGGAGAARHGKPKMTMWTAPSLRSASSLIRPPLRN